VQGHLQASSLEVEISSTCAHSGEAIELVVDSELSYRIAKGGPEPLVFEPEIDWTTFKDPNIIHGY
jgi:hypothetical protein